MFYRCKNDDKQYSNSTKILRGLIFSKKNKKHWVFKTFCQSSYCITNVLKNKNWKINYFH